MQERQPLNKLEIQERAIQAQQLIDNPLFKGVIHELTERSLQELRTTQVGDLTAAGAHARIRALDEILNHLKSIVNDDKVASAKGSPRPPITR